MTTHRWSTEQTQIFTWFEQGSSHLVVRARAGTGKTTTILEGIHHVPPGDRILLAAFNRHIAKTLKTKLRRPDTEARTLHGSGYRLTLRHWPGVQIDPERPYERAKRLTQAALDQLFNAPVKAVPPGQVQPPRRYKPSDRDQVNYEIERSITELQTKGREMLPHVLQAKDLEGIAFKFDLVPDVMARLPTSAETEEERWGAHLILDAAYLAMQLALTRPIDGLIDYADMIYQPCAQGWIQPLYDLVVVDEAQDMNEAQLELAMGLASNRICLVGDDKQAIYGFRGADSKALDRLKRELQADELRLTTTYRCARAIVAQAQKYVQPFQAREQAPEGRVSLLRPPQHVEGDEAQGNVDQQLVQTLDPFRRDAVLSRTNAPLVSRCLACLRQGKPAYIVGVDVGKQLTKIVIKLTKGTPVPIVDFLIRLSGWETDQVDRLLTYDLDPDVLQARKGTIHDQMLTLRALTEDLEDTEQVRERIQELFGEAAHKARITFSTVHKAKGLEWDRVFLLRWTFNEDAKGEERNICYVAVTRAINELYWVGESKAEQRRRKEQEEIEEQEERFV